MSAPRQRRLRSVAAIVCAALCLTVSASWPVAAVARAVAAAPGAVSVARGHVVDDREEIEQGRRADRQIEAEFGFYSDPELAAYVTRIGASLAALSERPSLPWTFRVLDSPTVNAFALPGGFVYVTRGILAYATSEAELAGVLGHEIGHVAGRHGAKRRTSSMLAGLGLLAGTLISPQFERLFVRSGLAQQGLGLLLLKYSRDQELDADRRGVRYAARAGYDASRLGELFDTLQRLEQQSGRKGVPSWASTHPRPDKRRARTDQAAAAGGIPTDQQRLGRAAFHYAIDGIVFGDNPREGFVRGQEFLHPELRFGLEFPRGWKVHNGRSSVVAINERKDAMIELTLAGDAETLSPKEYANGFLRRLGARVESFHAARAGGLPAQQAVFTASDGGGSYAVMGLWIAYGGRLYQLLGVTAPRRYRSYQAMLRTSLFSFHEVGDTQVLRVQPARIEIVRLSRPMLLRGAVEAHPENTASLETVAILNHMDPDDPVPAGTLLKLVTGGVIPEAKSGGSDAQR